MAVQAKQHHDHRTMYVNCHERTKHTTKQPYQKAINSQMQVLASRAGGGASFLMCRPHVQVHVLNSDRDNSGLRPGQLPERFTSHRWELFVIFSPACHDLNYYILPTLTEEFVTSFFSNSHQWSQSIVPTENKSRLERMELMNVSGQKVFHQNSALQIHHFLRSFLK